MFEKYDAYQDSGVEWLGEIPSDWEVLRFRDICDFGKGLNITKENLDDIGIPCVNYGEVHSKYSFEVNPEVHQLKCVSEDYLKSSPKSLLRYGDFVFADTSEDIDGSGNFTYLNSHQITFAGYHTVIVRPKNNINVRFLAYVFDSLSFRNQIRKAVKGVKVYSITKSILKDTNIWLPDVDHQYEISKFLDQKTSEIDQAIAIKEQKIALLNERKQIVIQKAVTQGLDPNVPMKDSGVEWLAQIPEKWKLMRLKFLLSEINIRSETGNETLLSLSKYKGVIPKDSLDERAGGASTLVGYKKVFKDNLVINKMQAVNGLLAVSELEGITSPDYSVYCAKDNSVNIHYIAFLLNQPEYLAEMKKRVTGVMEGFIRLYTDDLFDIKVLLPSYADQLKIVQYINTVIKQVEEATSNLVQQIEKLKEYKTTLINDAVTGKIKVA